MNAVAVKIIEPQDKKKVTGDGKGGSQKGGSGKEGSQKAGSQKAGSRKGGSKKQQNSRAPTSNRNAASVSGRKGSSRNQQSAEKMTSVEPMEVASAKPVEVGSKRSNMSPSRNQRKLRSAEPVGEATSKNEAKSTKQQGSQAGGVGEAKALKAAPKQMTADQLVRLSLLLRPNTFFFSRLWTR